MRPAAYGLTRCYPEALMSRPPGTPESRTLRIETTINMVHYSERFFMLHNPLGTKAILTLAWAMLLTPGGCAGGSAGPGGADGLAAGQPAVTVAGGAIPRHEEATVEITREELADRIYGGWLGQMIGGLEGPAPRVQIPRPAAG